jgi:hypothetical protein
MLWIFVCAAGFAFLWIAAPTSRTLVRKFEPTERNDAVVFQAQHSSVTFLTSESAARRARRSLGRPSRRQVRSGMSTHVLPGSSQNDASSRSIRARSVCSAIFRSADRRGSVFWAKNCAAAILPS